MTLPAPGPQGVLVLGGARSGKSAVAEGLLAGQEHVRYLATGPAPDADDPAWATRVAAHRERRPPGWTVLETAPAGPAGVGATARALREAGGACLLDGVGTWLAGVLDIAGAWDDAPRWREELRRASEDLVAAWAGVAGPAVAVSDEVGQGVVPATASGRLFRDELGLLNQRLAAASGTVLLAVAGRVLPLTRPEEVLVTPGLGSRSPGGPGGSPRPAGAR